MNELTPFSRGLSPSFMDWLSRSPGRSLLDLFERHGLDVRLRDDYLNAYQAQCSIAKLEWRSGRPHLTISTKYIVETGLALSTSDYTSFPVDDTFVERYALALPFIRATTAATYAKEEGLWEERCVRANLRDTPLVVLDRQIANTRMRLDVLAVYATHEPALVAIELKRDLDGRIQHVAIQAAKYAAMLDPDGWGLRTDVAESYARVCAQMRALSLAAPDPSLIRSRMPVLAVVGLANYNERSQLLARARRSALTLPRTVKFCFLDENNLTLPSAEEWFA
jgi:hypothetical protein